MDGRIDGWKDGWMDGMLKMSISVWSSSLTSLFVWFDRPGESSPEKDCCW